MPAESSQPAPAADYVVVARRYRPQNFGELIGQQQVSQALTNAIETNRVGHAYLFTGARGVGKTSTARILSKSLNCVAGPTPTPCETCDICESISAGEDVDVIEIDGASNRGIDEIRQLRSNVNVRPSRARFKIYIIDEVHMLTKEAFNALLKTLEEPPDHVKFIFCTTDPEKIPITVLSRCQRFDFPPVSTGEIIGRLRHIVAAEGASAEDSALELLARRAAGSLRDSQSLLEQLLSFAGDRLTVDDVHQMLGTASNERVTAIVQALKDRQPGQAMQELDAATGEGVNVGQLAEQLLGHLRDLMAIQVGCGPENLLFNSVNDFALLKQVADSWGPQSVMAAMQILDQAIARQRHSMHPRVLVELALVRISNLEDLDALASLVKSVAEGGTLEVATSADAKKKTAAESAAESAVESDDEPPASLAAALKPAPAASKRPAWTEPRTRTPGTSAASSPAEAPQSSQPQPRTSSSDTPASEPNQAAARPLTPDNVRQIWREAVGRLEGLMADLAGSATQVELGSSNQLVVTFPAEYNSSKSYLERPEKTAQLEQVLVEVAGRKLRIDYKTTGKVKREVEKPRSQNSRQLVQESYKHPFVQAAIELFEAEVVAVQPPQRQTEPPGHTD